jgi:hypothetical protein
MFMLIFAVARFAKILRGRFIDDTLTFVSGHSVDFVSIPSRMSSDSERALEVSAAKKLQS